MYLLKWHKRNILSNQAQTKIIYLTKKAIFKNLLSVVKFENEPFCFYVATPGFPTAIRTVTLPSV